jgi:predicted HicB family RNase H-like nuclease
MHNKKLFQLKHSGMEKTINDSKRINLTVENDFYAVLKEKAKKDYLRVGTWVMQFLRQNVKNNSINS